MIVNLGSRPRLRAAAVVIATFAVAACSGKAGSNRSDTTSSAGSVAQPADSTGAAASTAAAPSMVRGTVADVSPTSVKLSTDSGATVVVALTPPVQVFQSVSSSLQNVKQNSFIGVTTVKQPNGAEQATEIHIFPEALRGLGEGSRMMAQGTSNGGSANRMTNGSVSSSSSAGGGSAAPSRMSNGSVASTNGSTLVVQYAGGSTTVTVPPNTPVTEIAPASKSLATGDKVVVLTAKNADGSLSTNRVMLMKK
ncbi:MAG: hypothetical protein ACHQWU_06120 [Gemmatimonadales bacterium]